MDTMTQNIISVGAARNEIEHKVSEIIIQANEAITEISEAMEALYEIVRRVHLRKEIRHDIDLTAAEIEDMTLNTNPTYQAHHPTNADMVEVNHGDNGNIGDFTINGWYLLFSAAEHLRDAARDIIEMRDTASKAARAVLIALHSKVDVMLHLKEPPEAIYASIILSREELLRSLAKTSELIHRFKTVAIERSHH